MAIQGAATDTAVPDEDRLRAHLYSWLGRFLAAPPDAGLLRLAAGLEGDSTPLGMALSALARAAAAIAPDAAAREYHDLFIGLGRGELVPYGSYYLTGFLNEKPLARLRREMAGLGIERAAGVKEPEDHVAALCDMMAGLIGGSFGAPAGFDVQKSFFESHLAPWAGRFFGDLESARHAVLYVPVGTVGRLFMEIEADAFRMEPRRAAAAAGMNAWERQGTVGRNGR